MLHFEPANMTDLQTPSCRQSRADAIPFHEQLNMDVGFLTLFDYI